MKHVFTIHSPITLLSSYIVADHLKLDSNQVILLTNNYTPPVSIFNTYPFWDNVNKNWFHKLLHINTPDWADEYINNITNGDDYTLYIDFMSFGQRILLTNSQCRRFHFIEEGTASYIDQDNLSYLTHSHRGTPYRIKYLRDSRFFFQVINKAIRGYSLRLLAMPYNYRAYTYFEDVKFFCYSDLAYPNIQSEKRVVVVPDRNSTNIKKLAKDIILNEAIIWIDDSFFKRYGLDVDYYTKAVEKGIKLLAPVISEKTIFVKLRPGVKTIEDNSLVATLKKNGYQVSILPDDLVIECVLAVSSDCTIIGNVSATLFYATVFGHKSFSIYSLLEKKENTLFNSMPSYWEKVKQL